jgi:ribosomal protein S18 acetylase RimI-like enzyme
LLEPVLRAGETYALPHDWSEDEARTYWLETGHEVFLAESDGQVVGTYFLRANALGGGAHVANCGFVTAAHARGQGIARAMCMHAQDRARERGFLAMQFNFVVASNERAVALWESLGFEVVGRLPRAFRHPTLDFVDVLVMFKPL